MLSNIEKNKWLQGAFGFVMGMVLAVSYGNSADAKAQKTDSTGSIAHASNVNPVVGVMDLSVLPVVKGNVKQYLPTPYGSLGGLLLNDGTQVIFSTMFGEAVKTLVHPGQDITIRGLKGHSLPLLQAFLIENQHGQKIEEDSPEAVFAPVPITGPDLFVHGQVGQLLYNLQGQVMGVVLQDGTVVYIRPSDMSKLKFDLHPGITLYARGMGSVTSMGKALQARLMGQTENHMIEFLQMNAPPFGAPAGSPSYDYIPR